MADLYRLACRVVIWLGEESDSSSTALSMCEYITTQAGVRDAQGSITAWGDASQPAALSASDWNAITLLLSRAWFDRLWVRQEIWGASLKSVVLCGAQKISLISLKVAFMILFLKSSYAIRHLQPCDSKFHGRLNYLFSMLRMQQDGYCSMPERIESAVSSMCVDPRDRTNAMLSPAEDLRRAMIPDYTKSVLEVYEQYIVSYIKVVRSLDILLHCGENYRPSGFPSWVRDWRLKSNYLGLCYQVWASCNVFADVLYERHEALRIRGIEVGQAAKVWPIKFAMGNAAVRFSDLKSIDELADLAAALGSHTRDQVQDDLCRVLFARKFFDLWHPPNTSRESFQATCAALYRDTPTLGAEVPLTLDTYDVPNGIVALNTCQDRSLFISSTGNIGLGPQGIQVGNAIVVFPGAKMPSVLGSTQLRSHQFELIGACHLEGYMYGEALFGPLPEGVEPLIQSIPGGSSTRQYRAHRLANSGEITSEDPRILRVAKSLFPGISDEQAVNFARQKIIIQLTPKELDILGVNYQIYEFV